MSCSLKRRCAVILILCLAMLLPSATVWAVPQDAEDSQVRQSRWMEMVEELVDWVEVIWESVDPGPGLDPFLRAETENPEQPED